MRQEWPAPHLATIWSPHPPNLETHPPNRPLHPPNRPPNMETNRLADRPAHLETHSPNWTPKLETHQRNPASRALQRVQPVRLQQLVR